MKLSPQEAFDLLFTEIERVEKRVDQAVKAHNTLVPVVEELRARIKDQEVRISVLENLITKLGGTV